MTLHGRNFIGSELSSEGERTFKTINPATGEPVGPAFHEATQGEIEKALELAEQAFAVFSQKLPLEVAAFLDAIADELLKLGDELLQLAQTETALPHPRLLGERARTVGQIKMFGDLVREGSWVEASIDRALPDRKPLPKPDVRRRLIPIGPVVIFGASNFPLAFSVPGGDTASALAAGNSVVFKAHPAHPGTSELVAGAIRAAVKTSGMPDGVFSLVHGVSHESGLELVRHRATKAVAFTGSLPGGRALFNEAARRTEPIPVYAEMGSTNPVFVLPGALRENGNALAEGLMQSVTVGVGQFCTNPGLVFGLNEPAWKGFVEKTAQLASSAAPGTMLYQGICERFQQGAQEVRGIAGVRMAGQSETALKPGQAPAIVFTTDSQTFLKEQHLREELFGPSTVLVDCASAAEMERIARELPGQLTATIHGTEEDLWQHQGLVSILQQKAGRLLFNGFPTGLEVCPSMHHGGPYPATTHSHFTSVGSAAIKRFVRPICFQNFPDSALPPELQNKNPRKIWRLVDGKWTQEPL
ncbi:MAG TPA: aldehyde dehydrogenase (NADP(+)) [Candidatus Dormibacteraeota bacterium]|nr:aldehyde dehydrogenase (NADP(+)) [Candidatus Dormibacteraeota bacterium]